MGKTYLTPKRLYRILHRIADRNIGQVERAFLAAVQVSAEAVQVERLADAIQRGDVGAALAAAQVNGQLTAEFRARLERSLAKAFTAAAAGSAAVVVPGMVAAGVVSASMTMRFDLVNDAAVRHARLRSSKLVSEINKPVRGFIRRTIAKGIREGMTVGDTARVLAEQLARDIPRTIGLTERQFAIYEKQRDEIAASDVAPGKAEARLSKLARTFQLRRARTIARTETVTSSNAGNLESIRAAMAAGSTGIGTVKRWWLVTPDDRLCPLCSAIPEMNPDGVGVDEAYQTPEGPVVTPGAVHPNCRCSEQVRVVVDDAELREAE